MKVVIANIENNMEISKLKKVTKVVVHANCPDGMASAIILKDALELSTEQIVFVSHTSEEYKEMPAEPGLLFCDCTPPQHRTKEFVDVGAIVLDHHEYSKDAIYEFGENGVFADKKTEPNVSGAYLAYREVWVPLKENQSYSYRNFVKTFAITAGIRDNWQQDNPWWIDSCEQAEILMFFTKEFWMSQSLDYLCDNWVDKFELLGQTLVEKGKDKTKSIAEKRWVYRTESGLLIAIIPTRNISDATDLVEDECDVVIGFSYTKNKPGCFPGLILSLRSFDDSFDCGKFCKFYGGGGHLNSAGCEFETIEDSPNPYTFICNKFEEYLNVKSEHEDNFNLKEDCKTLIVKLMNHRGELVPSERRDLLELIETATRVLRFY